MALPKGLNVPLLGQLVPGGIKPGTMVLVEYDPDSQWLSVATTIAGRFFQANNHVAYLVTARSPVDFKHSVSALGIDLAAAESTGRFAVEDWYTATLTGGRIEPADLHAPVFEKVQGELRVRSLRVADLSLEWLKTSKTGPQQAYDIVDFWPPGSLIIVESFSGILRFNEEKAFLEWMESRVNPEERKRRSITIQGVVRGIHTEWLYKRMENISDGVIDLRVMERGDETKNLLRLRSLKGQPHDTRWHEVNIKPNGEATLVP